MDSSPLSLNERNERVIQGLCSSGVAVSDKISLKMRARRRLVKHSSNSDEPEGHDQIDPPSFDFDFDSPEKNPQIRDILSDLSSKLDSLSIQKNTNMSESAAVSEIRISAETGGKMSSSEAHVNLDTPEVDDERQELKGSLHLSRSSDGEDCVVLSGKKLDKVCHSTNPTDNEKLSKEIDELAAGVPRFSKGFDDDNEESEKNSTEIPRYFDEDIIRLTYGSSKYVLPGEFAKILYPHQRDGIQWLWSIHCMHTGGILGDDMGLGKTMQIAAFLAGLFNSNLIKRALIVAPKTLLTHWIKELTVVGLSAKIREYFSSCQQTRQYELIYILQDNGILLTTYDIVRTSSKSLRGESYFYHHDNDDGILWDYVILDEGHIIKNPSTQRARSLLEIPSNHRIIISGTPLQNNLKELWALFNFCCPHVLGSKQDFKEKYEGPILRANNKSASSREKMIGSHVAKELRECIKPYFLRRLKHEVSLESEVGGCMKLSKKHEMIVWLKLTHCQRSLYESFLKSEMVLSSFDGSPLAALTILKKICDHPLLLTKKAAEDVLEGMDSVVNEDGLDEVDEMAYNIAKMASLEGTLQETENISCKITFLVSLLDNLIMEGHSILIFSQTRKMLNLIQDAIKSNGYTFLRIDGTTKVSDRQKLVDDFQSGCGPPIFLLTSKVGGLGITLTNADRVIMVDPAWNPSTDDQSVDRAYRIGQRNDVIVYRLITCGTIEEKIYKMQVFKGGLFKTATEHREQTKYFSQRDLQELFTLPPQGFDVSLTQKQLQEEHDCHDTMDEFLKDHVKFLKTLDIAGLSHHSLLFSKESPATSLVEEENTTGKNWHVPNGSSSEFYLDGTSFAFSPKDINWRRRSGPNMKKGDSEDQIQRRLQRLRETLANEAIVLKLPDKGAKMQKHILHLSSELEEMRKTEGKRNSIINVDEVTEMIQRISC